MKSNKFWNFLMMFVVMLGSAVAFTSCGGDDDDDSLSGTNSNNLNEKDIVEVYFVDAPYGHHDFLRSEYLEFQTDSYYSNVVYVTSCDKTQPTLNIPRRIKCSNAPEGTAYHNGIYEVVGIEGSAFSGSNAQSITLPSSICDIKGGAFSNCKRLKSISIPNSVETLESAAFSGCERLEVVNLPSTTPLKHITQALFDGCIALKSFEVPKSVITIEEFAFRGCTSLETVTLHEGITDIGADAFNGCSSLKDVVLPETMCAINRSAFEGCSNLKSINFPSSIIEMGVYCFSGCKSLEKTDMSRTSLKEVPNRAFLGCTSLNKIVLPKTVTVIDDFAFAGTNISEIELPAGLKSIGGASFQDCKNIKEIEIPEGITTIPSVLFEGCTSLESITLPSTTHTVGHFCDGCIALKKLYVKAITPPSVGWDKWDSNVLQNCTLYIPRGTKDEYTRNISPGLWYNFNNIVEIDF